MRLTLRLKACALSGLELAMDIVQWALPIADALALLGQDSGVCNQQAISEIDKTRYNIV